jgi:cysteine-rich repeat protein
MRPLRLSLRTLFVVALTALVIPACGFGDDRNRLGDDTADDTGDDTSGDDTGDDAPVAVCGDGQIDPGEQCDDEDLDDGDGCDAECAVEAGWSCTSEPSECDMEVGECGDGAIANGEDCDDDNTAGGDGCAANCTIEDGWECSGSPSDCNLKCGNGHIDPGEECDGGPNCDANCQSTATVACELVSPQSGCEGTQACDIVTDDGETGCRDVTGSGTSNSHCATDTACSAGYTCVGDLAIPDDTECMRFCNTDANCNGDGSRCLIELADGDGNPIPDVTLCTNHCEPLTQNGCPSGQGCIIFDDGPDDFTDCEVMGNRLDGQSCTETEQCMEGSICVGTIVGAECASMCEVGDSCPTGGVCGPFSTPVIISGIEIGVCP